MLSDVLIIVGAIPIGYYRYDTTIRLLPELKCVGNESNLVECIINNGRSTHCIYAAGVSCLKGNKYD